MTPLLLTPLWAHAEPAHCVGGVDLAWYSVTPTLLTISVLSWPDWPACRDGHTDAAHALSTQGTDDKRMPLLKVQLVFDEAGCFTIDCNRSDLVHIMATVLGSVGDSMLEVSGGPGWGHYVWYITVCGGTVGGVSLCVGCHCGWGIAALCQALGARVRMRVHFPNAWLGCRGDQKGHNVVQHRKALLPIMVLLTIRLIYTIPTRLH